MKNINVSGVILRIVSKIKLPYHATSYLVEKYVADNNDDDFILDIPTVIGHCRSYKYYSDLKYIADDYPNETLIHLMNVEDLTSLKAGFIMLKDEQEILNTLTKQKILSEVKEDSYKLSNLAIDFLYPVLSEHARLCLFDSMKDVIKLFNEYQEIEPQHLKYINKSTPSTSSNCFEKTYTTTLVEEWNILLPNGNHIVKR